MLNAMDAFQLNYEKEYEYFCIKNCIKQILTFYGVHTPIFYINCSLGWQIVIFSIMKKLEKVAK